MKTIRNIIGAVLLLCAVSVQAAGTRDMFTYKGTAQGATNSYAIIEKQGGEPGIHFVEATIQHIDNTNSVNLAFYTAGVDQTLKQAGISGTNALYLNATNGWVIGDVAILSRNKDSAFERHTISAVNATSVTISGTTAGATVAGDHLWKMSVAALVRHQDITVVHAVAPASLRLLPTTFPYFSGPEGRPCMVEIQGTQTNVLNSVSGKWYR